jgi:hypothetical protein
MKKEQSSYGIYFRKGNYRDKSNHIYVTSKVSELIQSKGRDCQNGKNKIQR